jgi:class 3 adenylate cyclase
MRVAGAVCVVVLGGALALVASTARADPAPLARATPLTSWRMSEGDDPAFALPGFDDRAWRRVSDVGRVAGSMRGGVLWYRTVVELTPEAVAAERAERPTVPALALPRIVGPHTLYVDGRRVEDVGLGDADFLLSRPRSVRLPPLGPRAVVALRVATPPLVAVSPEIAKPGAPVLAAEALAGEVAARLRAAESGDIARTRMAGAFYAFLALYHVYLWRRRRSLVAYGWYAMVLADWAWQYFANAAAAEGRGGYVGTMMATFIAPPVLGAPGAFWMLYALIDATRPPRWVRAVVVLSVAMGLCSAVLLAARADLSAVAPALFWGMFGPTVVAFVACIGSEVVRPALRGNREAAIVAVGFLASVALSIAREALQVDVLPGVGVDTQTAGGAAIAGSLALALAHSYTRSLDDLDRRNRDLSELNLAMRRFLPDAFLSLLRRGTVKDIARGDSTELEMTVLFSDVRGFTTLSERLGSRGAFDLINRYLERVEPAIHGNRGFISQYYGDGIMALFHTGADDAVRCAVEMQRALERFNEGRDEPLGIGVGLNTGRLMLGTIGGGERLACNVIGDPANLAARIEGMTRMYGARVLLSEATAAKLSPGGPRLRRLDRVVAKGKTQALTLYEVLDADPPALRDQKLATLPRFEAALDELAAGRFEVAAEGFEAIARGCPDDAVAAALARRAQALTTDEARASWDGAVRLLEK